MHFKRSKLLIVLFFTASSIECLAQEVEPQSLWIISFERKVGREDMGVYYWYTRVLSDRCVLYPLSLPLEYYERTAGRFPADCLSDCNGYPFSEQQQFYPDSSAIKTLFGVISKQKCLIQTITHKWRDKKTGRGIEDLSRKKETINVYATPVTGIFETGKRILTSVNGNTITCPSLCPISRVQFDLSLRKEKTLISYYNFSYIEFSVMSSPTSSASNIDMAIAKTVLMDRNGSH